MNADEALAGYRDAIVDGNYEKAGECLSVYFRVLSNLPEKIVMQRDVARSLVNHAIGYCNAEAERIARAESDMPAIGQ